MWSLIKKLGRGLTLLRNLFLNIIFLVILIIVITAIVKTPKAQYSKNTPLYLKPSGILVDQLTYNPSIADLFSGGQENNPETLTLDLINAILRAKNDSNISALIIDVNNLSGGGISKIEEIGQAIDEFKTSGKPVIAYGDTMSQQQYFLASYADRVYLNEMGALLLYGFGSYRHYLKDAADKLSLEFNIFRVGEFKDAVEPLMRNNMSEASREHKLRWISSLWQRYTQHIEQRRNITEGTIDKLIANMPNKMAEVSNDTAKLALENKLIDGAISKIQWRSLLEKEFGLNFSNNGKKPLSLAQYSVNNPFNNLASTGKKIGLVVASGVIYDGNQPAGSIGGDSLARLLRSTKEDASLDALVIRVDSGGGSAFASEVIRQQIQQLRDDGLPVYISMGSVAASGGYWIASNTDGIWATPATITGSIGVFGLIPNISKSLNKIGIQVDGVASTKLASGFRLDLPMSEEIKAVIQGSVENTYQKFLNIVANSRNTDPDSIHKIAGGRVWTGQMAKELNLVDDLGSLRDLYAHIAQGTQYTIKLIEPKLSPKEQFLKALTESTSLITRKWAGLAITPSALKSIPLSLSKQVQQYLGLIKKQHELNTVIPITACLDCETL